MLVVSFERGSRYFQLESSTHAMLHARETYDIEYDPPAVATLHAKAEALQSKGHYK